MNAFADLIRFSRNHGKDQWVLATLVRVEGSAYRSAGARLLVSSEGWFRGAVSGGCLEEEIAARGLKLLAKGSEPELLAFDTRRFYGCEGRIEVLIEHVPAWEQGGGVLGEIERSLDARKPCQVDTRFEGGGPLGTQLAAAGTNSGVLGVTVLPPLRALVFGSGPECGPLEAFGSTLGWVMAMCANVGDLPADFEPDSRTIAVIAGHNFGRDLAVLRRILPMGLSYVGLLGPRKRRLEIFARLSDIPDFDPASLACLHGPAGLDLGGETPEEIALSIVSEITAVIAGRRGGFLRDRQGSIHGLLKPEGPVE